MMNRDSRIDPNYVLRKELLEFSDGSFQFISDSDLPHTEAIYEARAEWEKIICSDKPTKVKKRRSNH